MRRQTIWTMVAAVLGLVAVVAIGYYALSLPTTLRVAVGPIGSENHRLIAVLAHLLAREKADVRLKIITTEGSATSAAALESNGADLAVLRSDITAPVDALGVVDLRREQVVLLAKPQGGVTTMAELRGKDIGVVSAAALNVSLIQKLLAYYGAAALDVQLRPLEMADAARELADGHIAAIMTVGVPTSRLMGRLDARVTEELGQPPLYLPISEAPAIAQRNPSLQADELVRGVFGGAPPHPPESIPTIAVTHRLVAHKNIDEAVIASLVQQIFALRVAIAGEEPSAARISAPDADRAGELALHPGASSYYEGNVRGFFDRYGDLFYIGIMALSICGSALAALASHANARRPEPYRDVIDTLLQTLLQARQAISIDELEAADQRASDVFAVALKHISERDFDQQQVTTFALTLDQVRHAIADRRRRIGEDMVQNAMAAQ